MPKKASFVHSLGKHELTFVFFARGQLKEIPFFPVRRPLAPAGSLSSTKKSISFGPRKRGSCARKMPEEGGADREKKKKKKDAQQKGCERMLRSFAPFTQIHSLNHQNMGPIR